MFLSLGKMGKHARFVGIYKHTCNKRPLADSPTPIASHRPAEPLAPGPIPVLHLINASP